MTDILAIDQSISKCAWVYFSNVGMINFGVIKTSKKDGDLFDRSHIIACGLIHIIEHQENSPVICREGLGFGNSKSNASRDLAYLVGFIECGIGEALLEVPPTSLKKFATGSGKADKDAMVESLPDDVLTRFLEANFKKSTGLQDLADAYWIGKYFEGRL